MTDKFTPTMVDDNRRVLDLLSITFPTISAAATEIINLEAILNLPKGTEHFVADLHGESDAFGHILRNASGNIRRKVGELYRESLTDEQIRNLCTLIYYPVQRLELLAAEGVDIDAYCRRTLPLLVEVCRNVAAKYTRSKVRKSLPPEFAYIIEELLHETGDARDKRAYYAGIIDTIISTGQAAHFVTAICDVIQRLSIDHLHILGDVWDRGPGAHLIMDTLCAYHGNFDMQWGNHDVQWMGAAAGNDACIANVLRLSLRYGNMATLEDGYGINLLPLATFAIDTYGDDPCEAFYPSLPDVVPEQSARLMARMHKAITIIQFKLEGAIIDRHPEWGMADRKLLSEIDFDKGTVNVYGKDYKMRDMHLPTVDPKDPYALTPAEADLIKRLHHSFRVSEKLRRHVECLFAHGCMYTVSNSNLLFHASMPLNADGSLREVEVAGEKVKGRQLMQRIGSVLRDAYNADTPADRKAYARDYFWYLWCGPDSPLFDKARMTTFERYFIEDKETHKEPKGHYYTLRDKPEIIDRILDEFEVKGHHRHIINGHVPVRLSKGETPIRADGKLMVIDGGFSKAYHNTTGMAGYTLVFHSRGFQLVKHEPFTSANDAVRSGSDIVSTTEIVELRSRRLRVADTDRGRELRRQIDELRLLLYAYRHGLIKERRR